MPCEEHDLELPPLERYGGAEPTASDPEPEPPALWQRERLLNAIVEEVAAKGYAGASPASVTARAGVPRAIFDANFASMEQCFIAAFDSLVHQLVAHTISAYYAPRDSWTQRVRAGLATCVAGICSRSQAARTYMLEAGAISPATRAHRAQATAMFEDALAEMLEDAPAPDELSPVTIAGITGGIWRVIEDRLLENRAAELPGLVDRLVAWALAYVPGAGTLATGERQLAAPEENGLAGELTAGAITEIIERDGRESAGELAYIALAPVIGHERAIATRRRAFTSARRRRGEGC